MDPGRSWRTLGVERQRREELRRLARRGRMLEAGRELDQGRFAERGAHEGNADRNPKREAHRHVDDRVADDGRGCRAAEDEVIAIDQVSGPGGRIGWRNERVQMVLAQQQIDALGRAKQGVLSQRLVVRESQRLDHVSGVRPTANVWARSKISWAKNGISWSMCALVKLMASCSEWTDTRCA